jgi:hypothetical protein
MRVIEVSFPLLRVIQQFWYWAGRGEEGFHGNIRWEHIGLVLG